MRRPQTPACRYRSEPGACLPSVTTNFVALAIAGTTSPEGAMRKGLAHSLDAIRFGRTRWAEASAIGELLLRGGRSRVVTDLYMLAGLGCVALPDDDAWSRALVTAWVEGIEATALLHHSAVEVWPAGGIAPCPVPLPEHAYVVEALRGMKDGTAPGTPMGMA